MFAIIAISIWAIGHLYVAWSLGRFVRNSRHRWGVWGMLGLNFAITLGAMSLRDALADSAIIGPLQWLAYVGMGTFALVFALCVARDLVFLCVAVGRWVMRRFEPASPTNSSMNSAGTDASVGQQPVVAGEAAIADGPADPSRRELFEGALNLGILGLAAAGSSYGFYQATKIPDIRRVDVPVAGLADGLDGLRIVQVSDIHVGPTIGRDYLQAVVDRVNGLKPDLIAMTGDMVDGHVERLREEVSPIRQFSAPHGAYYVTGNHEYYWDGPAWCAEAERCGMRVLNNAHHVESINGARLVVGGVTDYRAERHVAAHKSDPHKALAGAPAADFRLLLAHQPKSVWEASKAGFDLQLSGHTHGGQFWPWSLLVGLAHPFSRGLHDYEKMKIYVSCGTGYWGPPLRLGAPSEITLLTLRKA